ncbi:hypothetical protein [Saccharopolyspora hattusasensis]|uniref:hypothetical protein n=1 Tax=Saccharopolyspora hattusasensis TaxID=1128679 RepID=UPI003D98CAF6
MKIEFVFPKFTHTVDMAVLPPPGTFIKSDLIGDSESDGYFVLDGPPILVFPEEDLPHYLYVLKRAE